MEKLGYNYNDLNSEQAKTLLNILLKSKENLKVSIFIKEIRYKT